MHSQTSLRHKLGAITGLWTLRTRVCGETHTCYFFRMGEAYYQAKTGESRLGYYLCQVEDLPEDVEALELPVEQGAAVLSVMLEEYRTGDDGAVSLCLKTSDDGYLRFGLDEEMIATTMTFSRETPGSDLVGSFEVEMSAFDTPAIPLPDAAVLSRRILMAAGILLFFGVIVLDMFLHLDDLQWLVGLGAATGFGLTLAAARLPWRFRCPYCGKAVMRPAQGVSCYACPSCGNLCRPARTRQEMDN